MSIRNFRNAIFQKIIECDTIVSTNKRFKDGFRSFGGSVIVSFYKDDTEEEDTDNLPETICLCIFREDISHEFGTHLFHEIVEFLAHWRSTKRTDFPLSHEFNSYVEYKFNDEIVYICSEWELFVNWRSFLNVVNDNVK